MKIPPPPDEHVARAALEIKTERDRRFLVFAGIVLVAIAMGFKSELLAQGQVWALALGLIVIATPALLGYLRSDEALPTIEHYIPVALGATTLAGLTIIVPEWWKYGLITVAFGAGFFLSARLDYLRMRGEEKRGHMFVQEVMLILVLGGAYLVVVTVPFNGSETGVSGSAGVIILRLLWIFTITMLASYRSFRINGSALAPRRALIFSLFVAQVVTFLAWAIASLGFYLSVNEGTFAVMLLFAWYINRGLVRHTVEDSFTRHVALEYVAFAAVLLYLFVSSYQPGR